jgi:TrmH family RNA methyltransferase
VSDLYWTSDAARRFPEIGSAVASSGGWTHEASEQWLEAVSGDAQGVVAVARDPWVGQDVDSVTADRLAAGHVAALVAVFEQLRDPGNAGAAIRAADAAGADLVVFADQSADPTAPKVVRSSAGSYFHVPVVAAGPVLGATQRLREAGLTVLAADGGGGVTLGAPELPLGGPARSGAGAGWFGNEARGLSAVALAAADNRVRIPIHGRAESLNVVMAATLCLYASRVGRHQA